MKKFLPLITAVLLLLPMSATVATPQESIVQTGDIDRFWHEYVHTQQPESADTLAARVVYEGVAEFVAELATDKRAAVRAMIELAYGDPKAVQALLPSRDI
jgi:hypothetical protein